MDAYRTSFEGFLSGMPYGQAAREVAGARQALNPAQDGFFKEAQRALANEAVAP